MHPPDLKAWALALALTLAATPLAAQDAAPGWNPRSGDAWIDQHLGDVNRYGSRYRAPFIDELVRYHGAPRDLVTDLLTRRNWAPGDVYYACAIAHVLRLPCGTVADEWARHHGEGWGALAQRMGIQPGSAEFHRLKRGFVPSYDRWGRPITLDAELQRVYPGRGHAKAAKTVVPGKPQTAASSPALKAKPAPASTGKAKASPRGGNGQGGKPNGKGRG